MSSVPVSVRHRGKAYDVEVDTTSTGEIFKYQVFSLTGVEPDRQKILIKGKQLKDDDDLAQFNLKAGQAIMMMGTASNDSNNQLVRPKETIKFVEDMTEAEAAQQLGATPAGLVNLGNTCYLNSTLQMLRSIPEIHDSLSKYEFKPQGVLNPGTPSLDLTKQLRDLYKSMSQTQEGFAPHAFLSALRLVYPQFAEKSKSGDGFAQQDAEEAWSQIIFELRLKLKLPMTTTATDGGGGVGGSSSSSGDSSSGGDDAKSSFIDRYMTGEFESTLECDEQAARDGGEVVTKTTDTFLKLNCHIDASINHLRDGLVAGLSESIEKRSTVLERDAKFTKRSRIAKLPLNLTVTFVRFFWKRDVQKKAKIMRKVTFPHELDVVEFCTDALQKSLIPVRDKIREVRKDEEDIDRARKRRKKNPMLDGDVAGSSGLDPSKDNKKDATNKKKEGKSAADGDTEMATDAEVFKTDAEWDAEKDSALLAAKKELHALLDQDPSKADTNQSGIYELRGVVTHQGASADSGHYTSYVKKTAPIDPKTGKKTGEEDGMWYWFNDDKVTEVTADKIDALAGGGESHSALILLYRAIPLPSADGIVE